MMDEIENLQLIAEVEKRIAEGGATTSFQEVLSKNGMTEADLKGWESVAVD